MKTEFNLDQILEDYAPATDIMTDEDESMTKLKMIVYSGLTTAERNTILLYSELGTQRKLGHALGVSPSTANHEISRIRKKIKDQLC